MLALSLSLMESLRGLPASNQRFSSLSFTMSREGMESENNFLRVELHDILRSDKWYFRWNGSPLPRHFGLGQTNVSALELLGGSAPVPCAVSPP